jgi:hypothetical protein
MRAITLPINGIEAANVVASSSSNAGIIFDVVTVH